MHSHFKSGYLFWSPHLTQRQKNYKDIMQIDTDDHRYGMVSVYKGLKL